MPNPETAPGFVCTFTCVYSYTTTLTHSHVQTCVYSPTHTQPHSHTVICNICIPTYSYTTTLTHSHVQTCVYPPTHTQPHSHTVMYKHVCTHLLIHNHTHTQSRANMCVLRHHGHIRTYTHTHRQALFLCVEKYLEKERACVPQGGGDIITCSGCLWESAGEGHSNS